MHHKVRVGAANNVRPHYVTAGAFSGIVAASAKRLAASGSV